MPFSLENCAEIEAGLVNSGRHRDLGENRFVDGDRILFNWPRNVSPQHSSDACKLYRNGEQANASASLIPLVFSSSEPRV